MKTISLFFKSVVILLFAGLSANTVIAQTEKKDRVEKVYDISPSGNLILSSGNGIITNIEILTWDSNGVEVIGEIIYEDNGNKEDIDKLLNAFKNINAKSSKDVLDLNLNLIKSSWSTTSFFRKKATTVLHNGDELSIDINKIKISYTIWIPETLDVKADCKYGKLKMASIKGNVNLTLFNNDVVMENFGESGIFDIKYSSATIGSGGVSKFNVFNGNVNIAEVRNVNIDAKYSKFKIAKANDVSVQSFNDSFDFGTLNDIDVSAKYSTIRIENNAGKSKFDFFNSKLFGKNFQTMDIIAKYSTFNAAGIGDAKIKESFQSEFNFETVNTFICQQSKYDKFKFNEIVVDASFPEAFNTNININSTSASFTSFSGNFKYGSIDLKINPNVEYNINYNGTYGNLYGVSPDKFKNKYISDKNGSKTTVQGLNAGAKCNIELVSFNVTCKIE